jgi:type I site-specific restriction endonuclease
MVKHAMSPCLGLASRQISPSRLAWYARRSPPRAARADYVLCNRHGRPMAVIEAKR